MSTNPDVSAQVVTRLLHLPVTSSLETFEKTAEATRRIVVPVATDEKGSHLEALLLRAVDAALDERGAAPGCCHGEQFEQRLADAAYRARLLGAGGLALRLDDLDRLTGASRALGLEDSSCLRRLLELAEDLPLQVYLPESSTSLTVIGAPHPLSEWLSQAATTGRVACIEYEPAEPSAPAATAERGATAEARLEDDCSSAASPTLSPPDLQAFSRRAVSARPPEAPSAEPRRTLDGVMSRVPLASGDELRPADPELQHRCARWAAQLSSMTGPKVHGTIEKAFVSAYVPLCSEVARGSAGDDAGRVARAWAEGFAQSYAAAFKRLQTLSRRPRMVSDVVEVSARWLGQHGARKCQILLVEGMRFDLGQRVNEAIEANLGGRATCTDQTLLWAALPNEGRPRPLNPAHAAPRTPASATPSPIRSFRAGSTGMFRLSRINEELEQHGEPQAERLQRLASVLSDAIVPWMQEQPSDTLVVLFGDHGFHWQARQDGTSRAERGGALPEQVLVPASAWMVGASDAARGGSALLH